MEIISLLVSVLAIIVMVLVVRRMRRVPVSSQGVPLGVHVHAMEVTKLSVDPEAGLAVFDLRCTVCGATHQRIIDSTAVERLAKRAGCTTGEARLWLMYTWGDAVEAERRIISIWQRRLGESG